MGVLPTDTKNKNKSKKRIATLLEKIEEQRYKINTLQVEVKQYKNRIRRIEQRQKRINVTFFVFSILLISLLVYNIWLA